MAAARRPRTKTRSRVPRFQTREEEAEFWDTHNTTDFEEEFDEVSIRVAKPLAHILGVRLDAKTITQLGAIGRKKGLGASTLARMWILERLEQEEATKPRPAAKRTRKSA
jgi:hypothetical protein